MHREELVTNLSTFLQQDQLESKVTADAIAARFADRVGDLVRDKKIVPIKRTFCDTNVCVHNTEMTSEAVVYADHGPDMFFCPGCDFELYIEDEE